MNIHSAPHNHHDKSKQSASQPHAMSRASEFMSILNQTLATTQHASKVSRKKKNTQSTRTRRHRPDDPTIDDHVPPEEDDQPIHQVVDKLQQHLIQIEDVQPELAQELRSIAQDSIVELQNKGYQIQDLT